MIGMRRGDRAQRQVVQPGGYRLTPAVHISSPSLHTLVSSTLGLNVRWGACVCVCGCHASVCVCMCLSVFMAAVGQALGTLEGGPYLARLLQLSRRKCLSSPHLLTPRPHPSLFAQVWSPPKLTLAPVQLTLASPKPWKQQTPWGALYGGSGL